jgi:hypothetical protein
VLYLDRTGSGNETAAHLRIDPRLTIMFCAVEGPPLILRLYGQGRVIHRDSEEYAALLAEQFGGEAPLGARQMVRLDIDLVQSSCGYGVPLFVVLYAMLLIGVLAGGIATWFAQGPHRRREKHWRREAQQLSEELERLRRRHGETRPANDLDDLLELR